jgi:hypothetical protein
MPLDAKCPFCAKAYRLKDELAGKKVTCANQDCRKVFTVEPLPPATPGSAAAPAVDAETMAMAVLKDEPAAEAPVENRTITMGCAICEHKWSVGWDMQGKNVLCPECKHRQKVPEQKVIKAADWRTGGGGPSMVKREVLENVTSARDTTMVSGETLVKTGVIDDGVEAVPMKVWIQRGLAVFAVLAAIGGGIWYMLASKAQTRTAKMFEDFYTAADKDDFKEQPLARAALRLSGAEYAARTNTPELRDKAMDLFNTAIADLAAVIKGADRDCLAGEAALVVLHLGGDDAAVVEKRKIPWLPQPPKSGRAQVRLNKAEEEGVRGSLSRVLQLMQKNSADFDLRAAVMRRVARDLIARKQIEVLTTSVGAGFAEPERPEVEAQIALELYRAGDREKAAKIADSLVAALTANPAANPAPVSAAALWQLLDVKGPPVVPDAAASGPLPDAARLLGVTVAVLKKDGTKALELATRAGPADGRVRALALAAEWAEDAKPFLDAAEGFIQKPEPNAAFSVFPLSRLAVMAAQSGNTDRAKMFANAITDAPLKAWTLAQALAQQLKKDAAVADEKLAELPADLAKDLLLGHVWGRLQLARHNGTRGDNKLAKQYLDSWPKPLIAPFGPAGVMLGQQDKELGVK